MAQGASLKPIWWITCSFSTDAETRTRLALFLHQDEARGDAASAPRAAPSLPKRRVEEYELIPRSARTRERERREGGVVEVKNKTVVGRKKIPREKKKYGRRDAERRVKKEERGARRTRGAREPRERGLNPSI